MAFGPEILVKLGMDGKGFQAGLIQAERMIHTFGKGIARTLAGYFSVGVITYQIKKVVDEAGKIKDMSTALGITTQQFQELSYAAEQTGTNVEAFGRALKVLAVAQQGALDGNQSSIESFGRLGITLTDLKTKGFYQIFLQLADSIKKGAIGAQNLGDLSKAFGRGVIDVLPAMNEGLTDIITRFGEMNAVIGDDTIEKLDELGDKWTDVQKQISSGIASSLDWFLGFIRDITNAVKSLGAWIGGFIAGFQENPEELGIFNRDRWQYAAEMAAKTFESELVDQAEEEKAVKLARQAIIEARKKAAASAYDYEGVGTGEKATLAKSVKHDAFAPTSDALAKIGGFTGRGSMIDIKRPIENIEKTVTNIYQQFREANIKIFESYHL